MTTAFEQRVHAFVGPLNGHFMQTFIIMTAVMMNKVHNLQLHSVTVIFFLMQQWIPTGAVINTVRRFEYISDVTLIMTTNVWVSNGYPASSVREIKGGLGLDLATLPYYHWK